MVADPSPHRVPKGPVNDIRLDNLDNPRADIEVPAPPESSYTPTPRADQPRGKRPRRESTSNDLELNSFLPEGDELINLEEVIPIDKGSDKGFFLDPVELNLLSEQRARHLFDL